MPCLSDFVSYFCKTFSIGDFPAGIINLLYRKLISFIVIAAMGVTLNMVVLFSLILALGVYFYFRAYAKRTGTAPLTLLWSILTFVIAAMIGWQILPAQPLAWDYPALEGLRLTGGKILTPEFMALTSGLVLYTGAIQGLPRTTWDIGASAAP